MALRENQSYLISKYILLIFTFLTLIATFVAYVVVPYAIKKLKDQQPEHNNFWDTWKSLIITYLIIEDLVAVMGLLGTVKEHYCLTVSYAVTKTILFFFGFSNSVLTKNYVFGWMVNFCVIISAFYFAHRIRLKRISGHYSHCPPAIIVTPPQAPAFIQISTSYIHNGPLYQVDLPPQQPPPPYPGTTRY